MTNAQHTPGPSEHNTDMNALEIRKVGESHWEVIHLPTGEIIPAGEEEVPHYYDTNKKRDVVTFYNRIKDAFPWHEWMDVGSPPAWAREAYYFCKRI